LEQTISRLEQQLNKKADKEIVELLQEENDEIKSDVDLVKNATGEVTLNEDVRNEIVTVATNLQNATKEELNRKLESYTPTNELRDSLIAKGFLTGNNLDNYLGANKTVSDLKQKIKTNNTTTSVVSEDLANNYLTKADFNAFKENNTNTINSKISNVNTVLAKAVTTDNLEDKLSSSVAFSLELFPRSSFLER